MKNVESKLVKEGMLFTEKEIRLLHIAHQVFVKREYALKVLAEKNPTGGHESWVTDELFIELASRGIEVRKKRRPDMIIDGIRVEVKAQADVKYPRYLTKDFEDHPDCDLHLFVAAVDARGEAYLKNYCREHDIEIKMRELGDSGWRVIIAKERRRSN